MKKSAIILSVVALMLLVATPVMAMGLAEDAKAAGYVLPGQEAAAPQEDILANAADYIKAGCVGVGASGSLVDREWIAAGEYAKIADIAHQLVEKCNY